MMIGKKNHEELLGRTFTVVSNRDLELELQYSLMTLETEKSIRKTFTILL